MANVSETGGPGQVATLPGASPPGTVPAGHPQPKAAAARPKAEGRALGMIEKSLPPTFQDHHPPDPQGLVPSAKTVRVSPSSLAGLDETVISPTLADVLGAAAEFGPSPWRSLAEDSPLPRWYITPGALVGTRKSARQIVRETEFAQVRRIAWANVAGQFIKDDPDWRPKGAPDREVASWSAKSRVNMVRTFASLDWGPVHELAKAGRVPAMVTLTYPGEWESVAPDGETVKEHVRALKKRYRRIWGEPVVGAWKLEFQHRGAPHVHIFMVPPHGRARQLARVQYEADLAAWEAAGLRELARLIAVGERWGQARKQAFRVIGPQPRWREAVGDYLAFRHWLSVNWADIVDVKDPAEYQKHLAAGTGVDYAEAHKCSDPKRLAVYFGKHGQWRSKEYQHVVPEPWRAPGKGPGRFWGYWGVKPLVAAVELTGDDYQLAARIMRRWSSRVRVWEPSAAAGRAGRWKYVQAMTPAKERWRDVDPETGEVVWRKRRRRARVRRFTSGSGFLVVNDGPAMARQLARALHPPETAARPLAVLEGQEAQL
jgi:hypothetical protein